jgi:hypothetical protein
MTKQIQSAAFAAFVVPVLLVGMSTAQAKQCIPAQPSHAHSHWSYRLIDGRKCWYEGQNNLSKSLLHWSERTPAQPVSTEVPASVETPKPNPLVLNDTVVNDTVGFEERWRGIDANGSLR